MSHVNWGQYLIVLSPSQRVGFLGVDVEMYVVPSTHTRNRYLRRVTLDTFLEYGVDLYGDKEEEPILKRELVDTTFVSGLCDCVLVKCGVDYVSERVKATNKAPETNAVVFCGPDYSRLPSVFFYLCFLLRNASRLVSDA
jgi:hypothetical protein